jgi:hypothetical protein
MSGPSEWTPDEPECRGLCDPCEGVECPRPSREALVQAHQFAPKYPVVCSCGFSAGFAMDNETPWLHHVAFLLRDAGFTTTDEQVADLRIARKPRATKGGAA